jgi:hypothetical protein
MTRAHVLHALPVFITALLATAPAARANIAPPTMLLVHVQPLDPNYCHLPGIYSCADLKQGTDEAGDLLFVIYLQTVSGDYGIWTLDFTVRFDWGWSLWGWESCVDANFSYDWNGGNEITFHYVFPDCPVLDYFVPVLALGITVNNDGCLEVDSDGSLWWGCHVGHDDWEESPLGGKAEAGAECAYACVRDCDAFGSTCQSQLTPEELHFEVQQGHAGTQMMHLTTTGGGVGSVVFDATEGWLSFVVTGIDYTNADVAVTANPGDWGLTPGEYTAWARATCDGRDCSRIYLTVTEEAPQSIPDDGASSPPEPKPSTWGAVKDLYRGR